MALAHKGPSKGQPRLAPFVPSVVGLTQLGLPYRAALGDPEMAWHHGHFQMVWLQPSNLTVQLCSLTPSSRVECKG